MNNESIPSSEPAKAVYADILVQHWNEEIETANDKIDDYRLSNGGELQWWFGYKAAIENAVNKYCSFLSPAEPAKESQPDEIKYTRSELFEICGGWSEHIMAITGARVSVLDLSDTFNDWFDKNHPSVSAPHPEPSEQSQPAFLEWLDGEIEDSLGEYAQYWRNALKLAREKYLSLHAQPKGEVSEEANEAVARSIHSLEKVLASKPSTPSVKPERETDEEKAKRIIGNAFTAISQPSPTVLEGEIAEEIAAFIQTAWTDNGNRTGGAPDTFRNGAIAMYRRNVVVLEKQNVAILNHIKTRQDLQSQLSAKDKEAQEYRKALEFVKESSWGAAHQNPIKTVVCEILGKYLTPKPTNRE